MESLIRRLAQWIARRLEAGNAGAAVLGATLGVIAGLAAAYLLGRADALGYFETAAFIILPIVCAFAGATAGAAMPARDDVELNRPIRLNNLNRALLPWFITGVLAIAVPGILFSPEERGAEELRWPTAAGLAVFAILTAAFAVPAVLWVDVTDREVVVRRLLGTRAYAFQDVNRWGFEVVRGRLTREIPSVAGVPFVLALRDGLRVEIPSLSPAKAAVLVERLSRAP